MMEEAKIKWLASSLLFLTDSWKEWHAKTHIEEFIAFLKDATFLYQRRFRKEFELLKLTFSLFDANVHISQNDVHFLFLVTREIRDEFEFNLCCENILYIETRNTINQNCFSWHFPKTPLSFLFFFSPKNMAWVYW